MRIHRLVVPAAGPPDLEEPERPGPGSPGGRGRLVGERGTGPPGAAAPQSGRIVRKQSEQ